MGKTREFLKMAYTHLDEEEISGSIWLFNLAEKCLKVEAK